jgi:hypothetical protein
MDVGERMKYSATLGFVALLFSVSCAHEVLVHGSRGPAAESAPVIATVPQYLAALKDGQRPWNATADINELRRGELTVWKLQEMAQKGQFAELTEIFNHGLTMDHLPVGYSAGAGVPFPTTKPLLKKMTEYLTGVNWRGKIFFDSGNPAFSHGFNRILKPAVGIKTLIQILPTAKFTTTLIDPHGVQHDFEQPELANGITSNFVVLNYADPNAKVNFVVEHLLEIIPVYDVMVAVPGKYGPLYVGKTWLGSYDKKTKAFRAKDTSSLIAWYFLDFNQGALDEQMAMHWNGGSESKIDVVDHQE